MSFSTVFNGVHYFLSLLCSKLQDHCSTYVKASFFLSRALHCNHALIFFVHLCICWNGGEIAA